MHKKQKIAFLLAVILPAFMFSLFAEPIPRSGSEKDISDIAKKVYPSVVKVETRNRTRRVATGVVLDKDGHIITTALISPRDEKIFVIDRNGKKINADFLGMDSVTHLALIKVEEKIPPIKLGHAKDMSPGSWIGVISVSPENTPAITQGIVSSVAEDRLRLNVWVMPGSSGSPVVDNQGRMIGLVRGIYYDDQPFVFEFKEKEIVGSGYVISSAEAPSSGMALAIPVDLVQKVATEIKEKGKVRRGWLGVSITDNEEGQVEIINVEKESPASLVGLQRGDIILEFDGEKVTSGKMFAYAVRGRSPGENVTLKIKRDGKEKKIQVKLGEYPEKEIFKEFEKKFPRLFPQPKILREPIDPKTFKWHLGLEKRKYIGLYLNELGRELSEFFGVKEGRGLLIAKLTPDSPAEKAGLKVGDVIVKVDNKRVETVDELSKLIQGKEEGDTIVIEFLRDKKSKTVKVKVEQEETEFSRRMRSFPNKLKEYSRSLGNYQMQLYRY